LRSRVPLLGGVPASAVSWPWSGSVSLPSTPGAGTVRRVSSGVKAASSPTSGASAVDPTSMVTWAIEGGSGEGGAVVVVVEVDVDVDVAPAAASASPAVWPTSPASGEPGAGGLCCCCCEGGGLVETTS